MAVFCAHMCFRNNIINVCSRSSSRLFHNCTKRDVHRTIFNESQFQRIFFRYLCHRNVSRNFAISSQCAIVAFTSRTFRCRLCSSNANVGKPVDPILKAQAGSERLTAEQTSEKSKSDSSSESWFSAKHAWKLGLISLVVMGSLMGGNLLFVWGAPAHDKDGREIEDEFSHLPKWRAYPLRASQEFSFFKKMIQEPSSQKLLPDPLKEPYFQPPYTLVLEMTGVLVHPDWTLGTGWRFKKRPAVDYFLQQVGPPLFEVVIYTHEQGFTAYPIIDGLDSQGFVMYRLFRDATRYMNGTHVKDLSCLNRDLSKVIIVDCDPKAYQLQRANAVGLKKWKGSDGDRDLIDLANFLRTIATSGVEDVRTVLQYYQQFDDPLEGFRENQRRLQEEQEKASTAGTEQRPKPLLGGYARGLTGRRH